jgi:hypothetical protein
MSRKTTFAPGSSQPQAGGRGILPRSALGWISIGATLLAPAIALFVMPRITMAYREVFPIVDTWVMPVTEIALLDAAAILNVVSVWFRRERSVLSIVFLVFALLAGLLFTAVGIAEAIGGG